MKSYLRINLMCSQRLSRIHITGIQRLESGSQEKARFKFYGARQLKYNERSRYRQPFGTAATNIEV